MPKVLIVIGSRSDLDYAQKCKEQLDSLGIENVIEVSSAHRHPEKTASLAASAEENGFETVIAMAGMAAALPGTMAANTNLPVIGVPLPATLGGIDSLLSIAQMPPGIPVAAMAVGSAGARNAAILAARILALKYEDVRKALAEHRKSL